MVDTTILVVANEYTIRSAQMMFESLSNQIFTRWHLVVFNNDARDLSYKVCKVLAKRFKIKNVTFVDEFLYPQQRDQWISVNCKSPLVVFLKDLNKKFDSLTLAKLYRKSRIDQGKLDANENFEVFNTKQQIAKYFEKFKEQFKKTTKIFNRQKTLDEKIVEEKPLQTVSFETSKKVNQQIDKKEVEKNTLDTVKESLSHQDVKKEKILQTKDSKPRKTTFFKIVIPNYNNEFYIKKCLDSIFSQTFKDFFVILVDDQSSDMSFKISQMYQRKHSAQMVALQVDKKGYAGKCRNVGIDYPIDSKYTWFIDSDDWINDNTVLQQIYDKCKSNPEIIHTNLVFKRLDNFRDEKPISKFKDIFKYGCGPARNIIRSDKITRFVENRSKWNDVVHFIDLIEKCNNIIFTDIYSLVYNTDNPFSSTNTTNSKQNIQSKIQLMFDLESKKYSKQICRDYKNKKIKDCKKLQKIYMNSCRKRIIAMASFPPRLDGMINTIEKLHNQCDIFYVWLNEYKEVPKQLINKWSNVVFKLAEDKSWIRENGRLFWINEHKNDYYLTVDDDINYPSNYVNNTIQWLDKLGNNVIVSYHGTIFDDDLKEHYFSFSHNVPSLTKVHRIGGGVAAMIPSVIKYDFPGFENLKDYDGDASISVWCTKHHIFKYVLPHTDTYLTNYVSNGKIVALESALCLNKNTKKIRKKIYESINYKWEKL